MDVPGLPHDPGTCHRLALDHVLALIADAGWSSQLVLRGSMLMTAYAGSAARKPGDLDFIMMKGGWPVDDAAPYPYMEYMDEPASVQQWEETQLREDLRRRIRENPGVGHGIVLDPEKLDESGDWAYSGYTMLGSRLIVPWEAPDDPARGPGLSGVVQLDFAADEPMPQRPVWTRIPRLAGGFSVVPAAGPELSLVWKLMWLVEDSKDGGLSRGKDLYDAVVLAELPALQETIRAGGSAQVGLRRREVDGLRVDWEPFVAGHPQVEGSLEAWKQRLTTALGLK